MPVISAFFGMLIRVFHADHEPPHIHVQYGEYEAIVEIKTGNVLKGKLPRRLSGMVKKWLELRRSEVMKAWEDARAHRMPHKVKPLE